MRSHGLIALGVVFAAATAIVAACVGEPTAWYCDLVPRTSSKDVGVIRQRLSARSSSIWDVAKIPVCWEDSTYDNGFAEGRKWVRDQIEDRWNKTLAVESVPEKDRVEFVGWTRCSADNDKGIVLRSADEHPRTTEIGRNLRDRHGVVILNFSFKNWQTWCSDPGALEFCIRVIATHEFGHALGLTHEQNRDDTPPDCEDAPAGTEPTLYLGTWDPDSIMNYCSPRWTNNGELTQNDQDWIRALYYPTIFQSECHPYEDEDGDVPIGDVL